MEWCDAIPEVMVGLRARYALGAGTTYVEMRRCLFRPD
jgi:hypothetical protein